MQWTNNCDSWGAGLIDLIQVLRYWIFMGCKNRRKRELRKSSGLKRHYRNETTFRQPIQPGKVIPLGCRRSAPLTPANLQRRPGGMVPLRA